MWIRSTTISVALVLAQALFAAPVGAETVFVDDAGRSVTIATTPHRVMPAGPPADLLIYAVAPDMLVGLVKPWSAEQKAAIPPAHRGLAIIPRLTPEPLQSDLGAVRELGAELVVDYGDVTPAYSALADKVRDATGIPAVLLDGHLAATPKTLRSLGALLGRSENAEVLAKDAEDVLRRLAPLSRLAEAERVPVYLGRGGDGLDAVASGGLLDEAIVAAGGRNVVERRDRSFRTMTVAEIAALAPRVVVVSHAAAIAPEAPLRRALPASTVFLLDDFAGFHVVENPASVNRIVGAAWLASRMHPGRPLFDEADLEHLRSAFLHLAPL